jgi:hypothetical protein
MERQTIERTRIERAGRTSGRVLGGVAVASVLTALALSQAGTLTIPYTFTSGTPALASQVNANFAAIPAVVNSLDDANYSNNGMTGSTKLKDLSVSTQKIADNAITSIKIADGTVVTADIADGTVSSTDILDATVATADLAANAVTVAGNAYTAAAINVDAAVYTEVQSLTITTTTANPAWVFSAVRGFSTDPGIEKGRCKVTRQVDAGAEADVFTVDAAVDTTATGDLWVIAGIDTGVTAGSCVYRVKCIDDSGVAGTGINYSERRLSAIELRR